MSALRLKKPLSYRSLRLAALVAVFAAHGWFDPGPAAQTDSRLILFLQATDIDAGRAEQLRTFFAAHPNGYYLVQGFACDTGGFDASYVVATNRGTAVRGSLGRLGLRAERLRITTPVVFAGDPRVKHRRAELIYFDAERDWLTAARAADANAVRINAETQRILATAPQSDDDSEEAMSPADVAAAEDAAEVAAERDGGFSAGTIFIPLTILLLIVMLFFGLYPDQWLAFFRGTPRREDHQLDDDEAEALEVLTGGEVTPLRRSEPVTIAAGVSSVDESDEDVEVEQEQDEDEAEASNGDEDEAALIAAHTEPRQVQAGGGRTGDVREFIRKARSNYAMGSKKKSSKKKVTPISIRGAVAREYEESSLGELSQAPIDALEGLTARHARMLEEAFGIQTVEDLARLKYVELARAICILARYEK